MYATNTKELRSILILFIIGIACLIIYAAILNITSLRIFELNDQAVYVDTARHVLNEGQLTTGVIYPSTLRQNYSHNYFYMPGHALAIALSLWLIGDSVVASLLPNLLAYLLCIILLYWIGSRLVNHNVGFMASFLFAIFPANINFAVSAMSEMTFVCAGLIAFATFLYLPIQFRLWLGPVLVCLPVLFRETGVFWCIPMAAVVLQESRGSKPYLKVLVLLGLSVILFMAILQLDVIKGRPSKFYLNLLTKENSLEWYTDAFLVESKWPESLAGWFDILHTRTLWNLKNLWWTLNSPSIREGILLNVLFWPPVLALIALRWLRPLRNFIAGYILMAFVMFAFLSLLYYWFTGVRLLLLLFPLEAIVVAFVFDRVCQTSLQRAVILCVLMLLALPLFLIPVAKGERGFHEATLEQVLPVLSTVSPDPTGVLVSNAGWGPYYVYKNYPAKWAFIPQNEQTLYLLHEKYPVATAVLNKADIGRLGETTLEKIGLVYSTEFVGPDGSTYFVFKRPQSLLQDK